MSGIGSLLKKSSFYIIAEEPGAENPKIPTWANDSNNPVELTESHSENLQYEEIENVPGAFQLKNVLSQIECGRLIALTEELGYRRCRSIATEICSP